MFNEYKLFVVLFIVLLIFGPKNLPKLAQALGRSVRELKNGMAGITDDIRDSVNTPAQAVKTDPPPVIASPAPAAPAAPVVTHTEGTVETANPTTPKSA